MSFCTAIEHLINDHHTLRKLMNECYELTEEIEITEGNEAMSYFLELYQLLSSFSIKLAKHSQLEEQELFPMMALYLGEEDTTIEQMEIKHHRAENFLEKFLQEAEQEMDKSDVPFTIQSITVYAVQAYDTLMQHFAKEEKKLFPLAEQMLSDSEKGELAKIYKPTYL